MSYVGKMNSTAPQSVALPERFPKDCLKLLERPISEKQRNYFL
ncbi:MAG: hypothetical protein QOI22_1161 [Verrucomicrobiota bacterium]